MSNLKLDLQAALDKVKSAANIKRDMKLIESKLPKIKLQGTLNSTETKRELNAKLKAVHPKVKIDADTTLADKKIKKMGKKKTNLTVTPEVDNSHVVSGLKQAQKETKTLWNRFSSGIEGINLIKMGVQEVIAAIRQAVAGVKELDAVKTNIQMATGMSDAGVNAMVRDYNSMAKELSSTTKEVAEAGSAFLRMGESVASTNELIASSQVLSKVGMIESSEAAGYLLSSLKGYRIAAEDSMGIVSKLTSVDLEAAVGAGGLAEALSKCADIAGSSGVALERLIGYTAVVGENTQKSMSEVGNSFQALLSRMNNIKIGNLIDDETGESLSETEAVLNKLGIRLRDTEDVYRSFDAVLDDVGSRWKDFTKAEQNEISAAIAGTKQKEDFKVLMNHYGNALKYAETATDSAGNALERYGVYQDSIQAKTNELTAAIESLSTNVLSEELYSGIIEAATGVVAFLDKTNLLGTSLAGLAAMGASKAVASIGAGFITAAKSTAQLTAVMALFDKGRSTDNLRDIGAACKGLSDKQLKLVLSTKGLTDANRKAILEGMGVAKSKRQQTLTTLGLAAAEDKATLSTFSLKGAFGSLRTAIAMNPIGAFVTAVSAATMIFSAYKQSQENVRQATEEAANAYKESVSSIDDYASRYQELRDALIAAKGDEEDTYNIKKQLLELQTELNKKFGDEYGAINLVTNAYKDQTETIRALHKETAQTFLNENKKGIDKAEKEMVKNRHYNLSYTGLSGNTDKGKAIKEIAEKYKEQGITLFDEYNDGDYSQFSVHLDADAQSAYETINAFENDLRNKAKELGDEHMLDDVLDASSNSLNKAKKTIDKYGDIYEQALIAEIVSDDDKAEVYSEALKAVETYNEAVLKSENPYDDENVAQAKVNLNAVKTLIQENEAEWGKYAVVIVDVFEQADMRLLEFNDALKTDSGIKQLADDLNGFSDTDLQALDENVGENESFDKLKEAAEEYDINTNELIDALVRLGYIQEAIQTIPDTLQSISPTISTTVQQIASQLEPQFAKLSKAYNEIFQFDDNGQEIFHFDAVDNSMLEELRQSFAEIKEEIGVTFDDSELDSFFHVLTNGNSTAEQVHQAFNDLATAYLYSTDTLEALNGETANAIAKQLEELGVQNATEIVAGELAAKTEELTVAKEYLAQTGTELASASDDEVNAFILEQIQAGNCGEALALLQLKKMLVNGTLLDTNTDINNILALAQAAGITSDALTRFASLKSALDNAQARGDYGAMNAISAEMSKAKEQIEADIANFQSVEFGSAGSGESAAQKAGSSAGDAYLDAFKKEYDRLKDMLDRGEISESQYLNDLRSLYTRYFKDRKEYLEEYQKYESEYLSGMLDLHNKALSGVSTLLNRKISAANDAKDSAISALEEEKEAAAEAYQAQIDAIEEEKDAIDEFIKEKEKKIDALNEEADAIQKAAETRKKNIDLQKEEYNLERMLNQRTTAVYKEGEGFVFETDTTGIRDARERVNESKEELEIDRLKNEADLIRKEIDLLEEKKDALTTQQEAIQKMMDESDKYYDNLIKQQEKMWDSMINGMEQQKAKWEELADIQEIAEAYAAVEQVFGELGYSVQDILNGNEQAFEDFKSRYIGILSDMNQNTSFQDGLEFASGVAKEKFESIISDAQGAAQQLSQTFSDGTFSQAITQGVSDGIVSAQQELDKMNQLGNDAGEGFVEGWKEKSTEISDATKLTAEEAVEAFAEGQDSNSPSEKYKSLAGDAIEGLLRGVEENKQLFIDAVRALSEEGLLAFEEGFVFDDSTIKTSFDSLILLIQSVCEALGYGSEDSVGGLLSALNQLSAFSFEDAGEGMITQFDSLKSAIDGVTSAISGGGGDSSGGDGSSGGESIGGKSKGGKSVRKGGKDSGGSSLTDAIQGIAETAGQVIGEPEAEGDGTVIGAFGALETAVTDVTAAIGGGESESGKGQGKKKGKKKGKSEEDSDNLIGSVTNLGETTEETLGESGGDGVIGRFEEFNDVIGEANEQVTGIADGLAAIDGQDVACTIKITIDSDGYPVYASGTALGAMNLNSTEYHVGWKGNAHVSGTANVAGNWGVRKPGRSLVGELGQEIWVHAESGTFETVGDNGPEFINTKKGDLIFNHLQTKELLDRGNIVKTGKAYANGTIEYSDGTIIRPDGSSLRPLQEGDRGWDLMQKFQPLVDKMLKGETDIISHAMFEHQRQMEKWTSQINNSNVINNIANKNVQPVVHQQFNITMPNITNSTSAEALMKDLQLISRKKLQINW